MSKHYINLVPKMVHLSFEKVFDVVLLDKSNVEWNVSKAIILMHLRQKNKLFFMLRRFSFRFFYIDDEFELFVYVQLKVMWI